MTREEHIAALEKYRDGILSGGISVPYDDLMIALDASIAALRGPEWVKKYNEYAEDGTVIKKTKPRRVFGLWATFQSDGFRALVECATLLSESLIDCVLDNGKPDKVEWVAKPVEPPERKFYRGHDASLGWKAIYGEKADNEEMVKEYKAVWEAMDPVKRRRK